MCVCVCVYIYIYIYVYIYIYIYTYNHRCSHVQLFAMLWTVALQAPLPMGFSRQEYWSVLLYMYIYIYICVCVCAYMYIYICSYISMNIVGDTSNLLWVWSITLGVFFRKSNYFSCFDDYERSNYLFFLILRLWDDVVHGVDAYLASNGSMGYSVYVYVVVSSFRGNNFKNN